MITETEPDMGDGGEHASAAALSGEVNVGDKERNHRRSRSFRSLLYLFISFYAATENGADPMDGVDENGAGLFASVAVARQILSTHDPLF